jgi:excisionase family DNA binding protein
LAEMPVKPTRILLKADEVAEALAISKSKVYELIDSGDLPSIHIGRSVRVPVTQLEEWVARDSEDN